MTLRSTSLVSPAVDALRIIDTWGARTAAAGVTRAGGRSPCTGRAMSSCAGPRSRSSLTGLALLVALEEGTVELDEPAGPPGLDAAPPARARVRPSARRRAAADGAWARGASTRTPASSSRPSSSPNGRDAVRRLLPGVRRRAARARRRAARLARVGLPRPARRSARARARAARADARRARDARRGDVCAVPGTRRRAARLRPDGAERLGPRLRAARRQVAALDGRAQLAAHVRPLRRGGDVPLGRSGARARVRRSDRQGVRRWAIEAWPRFNDLSRRRTAGEELVERRAVAARDDRGRDRRHVAVRGTSIASATSPK